jgi:CheY-like chemotaxis protein
MSELDCPRLDGTRVLVVEDDADTREMIAITFERSGAWVDLAESAAEAFVVFQRERPHVVLMDLGLPDEDGFCLLKRLRELPASDGEVLAVALSGSGSPEDRDKTRTAGFQAHLMKPVGLSELLDLVVQVVRAGPRPATLP